MTDGRSFDMTVRVTVDSTRADERLSLSCPVCGFGLIVHQPEPGAAHRLLATCGCAECGLWFSVLPSADRSQVYLVRLPSMAELREAMARQGLE
jgi:hypothetical protein